MTTNVTVKTSSHDVKVFQIDPKTDEKIGMTATLAKGGTERTFYAHQSVMIIVKEVSDGSAPDEPDDR